MSKAVSEVMKELIGNFRKLGVDVMGEEIETIVQQHSIGSACAGFAAAFLPGVGGTIAATISAGFVWSMYYRINKTIGIPLSKNIVKSVGTAVCTNLAMGYAGAIAAQLVLSFIPGANVVGAFVIGGACYGTTWCSGLIYLKVLSALAQKGVSFANVTKEDLDRTTQDVLRNTDIEELRRQAKQNYEEAKKRGEINKNNTFKKEEGFE